MHNFQLKLLTTETSRANEDRKRYEKMVVKDGGEKKILEQLWATFFPFGDAPN